MKIKRLLKAVVFAVVFVLLFLSVQQTLIPYDALNYQHIAGFYEEREDSLDAVYIGSSNCFIFWNSAFAWKEHGITVYPYACNSLSFYATEHLIKEARKTQPDAMFIVNINAIYEGGMNMSCYFKDEEETAAAMANGIVYSNDIGYVDEDGDVILLGRKGDVINVGGNKVSPDEIENAAKLMADIADCGCIPVPDPAKGSVPKLFVQMKKGRDFDGKEIRAFLASKLEPYKVPQYIEEIAEIPRSYNGKLLRKNLKELG